MTSVCIRRNESVYIAKVNHFSGLCTLLRQKVLLAYGGGSIRHIGLYDYEARAENEGLDDSGIFAPLTEQDIYEILEASLQA